LQDLIATVSALTLAVRVIGGSLGYAIYFNLFATHFTSYSEEIMAPMLVQMGFSVENVTSIIQLTELGLLPALKEFPPLAANETLYNMVVAAGQETFALSYQYVYYASIAFGAISIICCLFLGDIQPFMDDKIAVHM
jgi:hypothetical protein